MKRRRFADPYIHVTANPESENQILYTTTDNTAITLKSEAGFGANLIQNSYTDGQGLLYFDGTITSIGEAAFQGCSTLKTIKLPKKVTSINSLAFCDCSKLEDVNIPENVTIIGSSAFKGCSNLTYIVIPNLVETLDTNAFASTGLYTCTIPDSVTLCGQACFTSCKNLRHLEIGNGVTHIPYTFCRGCTSLQSVSFGANIDTMRNNAFQACDNLKHLIFNCTTVKSWFTESYLLALKNQITQITLKDVSDIEAYTFNECSKLEILNIGEGITTINDCVFQGCAKLNTINFDQNTQLSSIKYRAFYGCGNSSNEVYQITLPDTITEIQSQAFEECYKLQKINIPKKLETIEYRLFRNCLSLSEILIPEGVTTIESYAFEGCSSLRYIVIPKSLREVGTSAFKDSAVNKRIKITSVEDYLKIQYPDYSIDPSCHPAYYGAGFEFQNLNAGYKLIIPKNITKIHPHSFHGLEGDWAILNSIEIVLHDNITEIGEYAFYRISQNVTLSMDGYDYYAGESLPPFDLIGDYAFYECGIHLNFPRCPQYTSKNDIINHYTALIRSKVIGKYAFALCSFKNVSLSIAAVQILSRAFFNIKLGSGINCIYILGDYTRRDYDRCELIGDYALYNTYEYLYIDFLNKAIPETGQKIFYSDRTTVDIIAPYFVKKEWKDAWSSLL